MTEVSVGEEKSEFQQTVEICSTDSLKSSFILKVGHPQIAPHTERVLAKRFTFGFKVVLLLMPSVETQIEFLTSLTLHVKSYVLKENVSSPFT